MRKLFNYIPFNKILLFIFLFSIQKSFAQDKLEKIEDTVVSYNAIKTDTANIFKEVSSQNTAVRLRSIPDSIVNKLRHDDAYWYANKSPQREKKQAIEMENRKNPLSRQWFKTLAWFIIIGGSVAILIWYLASSNIHLFRRNASILSETINEKKEENIFDLNYDYEIKKAVEAANYNLAIRLWYLQTLKDLAEKNIIEYKQETTNSTYLAQLSDTKYYKDFFRLTRNFEYTWYGKFHLSADAFTLMQNDFATFKQKLH